MPSRQEWGQSKEEWKQELEQEQGEMARPAATPTGSPNGGRPVRSYSRLASKEQIQDTYIGSPHDDPWPKDVGVQRGRGHEPARDLLCAWPLQDL